MQNLFLAKVVSCFALRVLFTLFLRRVFFLLKYRRSIQKVAPITGHGRGCHKHIFSSDPFRITLINRFSSKDKRVKYLSGCLRFKLGIRRCSSLMWLSKTRKSILKGGCFFYKEEKIRRLESVNIASMLLIACDVFSVFEGLKNPMKTTFFFAHFSRNNNFLKSS